MFIKMWCAKPTISWVGLRDCYGSRFQMYCTYPSNSTKSCSNSLAFTCLLGPPEIHQLNICPSNDSRTPLLYPPPPPIEEPSDSDSDTPNPHLCLILFIKIDDWFSIYNGFFHSWLNDCWNHDSLTTLRIIGYTKQHSCTIRHGREIFYIAALWLHSYHPKTLADNVKAFSKLGCLKDWLEILYRLVKGPLVRKIEIEERNRFRRERQEKLMEKRYPGLRVRKTMEESEQEKMETKVCSREERRIRMARKAIDIYNFDPNYRYLFDKISDHFAELLKSDLKFLDSGDFGKISLASKWCPSIDSSYDQATLICESIARRLFQYDSYLEYRGISEAHYAYRVRRRLQHQVLVPLRRALKLPEVYMSSNEWNLLPYDRVSFTALRTYWRLFTKHDKECFLQYINDEDAKKQRRKPKLSSDREMFPHDIVRLPDLGYGWEVAETQWGRMVEAFSRKGYFKNCIVISGMDIFGRLPRHLKSFSISFQLLVSDLSESPWRGNILRQVSPKKAKWSKIEGDDLQSKMECLRSLCDDGSAWDVWILIDKILEFAVDHNISREKMVRRVFVLSSSLAGADSTYWWEKEVDLEMEARRKKYEECGYRMPKIVIGRTAPWSVPLADIKMYCNDEIMLIRDWSPKCMELFLEQDGKLEEDSTFKSLISSEDYMELKVLD